MHALEGSWERVSGKVSPWRWDDHFAITTSRSIIVGESEERHSLYCSKPCAHMVQMTLCGKHIKRDLPYRIQYSSWSSYISSHLAFASQEENLSPLRLVEARVHKFIEADACVCAQAAPEDIEHVEGLIPERHCDMREGFSNITKYSSYLDFSLSYHWLN